MVKPSNRAVFSRMNPSTCASPRLSKSSTLSSTITIFLPHSRISCMKARSLSLKGRSAEVTKRIKSERGTKPCEIFSCSRMIALVPGVSTTLMSRRKRAG